MGIIGGITFLAGLSITISIIAIKPWNLSIFRRKGKVLYVGKAKNLRQRASSYFTNRKDLGEKTKLLVSKVKKLSM